MDTLCKWLDDYEKDKETKAKLENKNIYTSQLEYQLVILDVVKADDGKVDFNKTKTGRDLKDFVDNNLSYLSKFK